MAEVDKGMNQEGDGFTNESLGAPLDGMAQWGDVDRWASYKRFLSLPADELDTRLQQEAELQAQQQAAEQCAPQSWPGVQDAVKRAMADLPVKETGTSPVIQVVNGNWHFK